MFVGRHIPFLILQTMFIRIYIKFKFKNLGEESDMSCWNFSLGLFNFLTKIVDFLWICFTFFGQIWILTFLSWAPWRKALVLPFPKCGRSANFVLSKLPSRYQ